MMILLHVERSKLLLFVSVKKLQYLFVQKMYRGTNDCGVVALAFAIRMYGRRSKLNLFSTKQTSSAFVVIF